MKILTIQSGVALAFFASLFSFAPRAQVQGDEFSARSASHQNGSDLRQANELAAASLHGLAAEKLEILRHLSLVYLDDGKGGLVKTIRVTGVNLQIVNGSDATNGLPSDPDSLDPELVSTNGVGNLIVGYNELGNQFGDDRTGSHNLVVGHGNSYSSFGGLVSSLDNTISSPFASVSGGNLNIADADLASVLGGKSNLASGRNSCVSGGTNSTASGLSAAVSSGLRNKALGDFSSVSGGSDNLASGERASISAGLFGIASGGFASVSGGEFNTAYGITSSISGGRHNQIGAAIGYSGSAISGGSFNTAEGFSVSITGGVGNRSFGFYSSVSGGQSRIASGVYGSWVGGGLYQQY